MAEKTNNHVPAVSIGMPVYNGEEYIREAIDSLLAQSFTDFELIISDNASTDKTQEICERYAEKDLRITYIRQIENIGPSKNFSFVLQRSVGKYFMWAAHDDRWAPQCLKKMVTELENDAACGLIFSNYVMKNLETGYEKMINVTALDYAKKSYNYMVCILNVCPSLIYGMYKTELIKNTKFELFDFADVHFVSELSLKTNIRVIHEPLYFAGTKGERKPYSISHKKIQRIPFLKKQYQMLGRYFSFPMRDFLFLFTCVFMLYNKIKLWRY